MRNLKRLIAILCGGIVGLFLFYFGVREFFETKSLQSSGKSTTGDVTDVQERSGRRGTRKYYLDVNFRTEQGQQISSRGEVKKAVYDQAARSRRVNVTYLPGKPEVHRFGPDVTSDFANLGVGVLVLGAAGISALRGQVS